MAASTARQVNLNEYRNARYVGGSAAPAARPQRKQPVRRPRVVKKTQAQLRAETRRSSAKALKIMAIASVLFGLLFVQIYSQLRVDELNQELNAINAQISVVQSDNTRRKMEVNSNVSLAKVDDYARNTLGMVKVNDYQVNYVKLSGKDQVVYSGGKTHKTLFEKLQSVF